MHRVAVIGISCVGKTTFARGLAERFGCSHLELDALYWGPEWKGRPKAEVRKQVEELTRVEAWVSCGNYAFLRNLL